MSASERSCGGGLFWPRASRHAGLWTLVVLAPIGLAAFLLLEFLPDIAGQGFWSALPNIQFLYGTGIMFVLSVAMFVAISLLTEAPDPDKVGALTWTRQTWEDETRELRGTPWWQNHRVLGGALTAATLAVVIPFI